jgi:methylenetetrahydrofolate reductase (NADPH)
MVVFDGCAAPASDPGAGGIDPIVVDRIARARLELIPTGDAASHFVHLPAGARVSITASPSRGLKATLDAAAALVDGGHAVVPHIPARLVESDVHVARIAAWLAGHGIRDVFVIGGDADRPHGPYADSATLIRALLDTAVPLDRVGFAGYPDGHASIPTAALDAALIDKQQLLEDAGIGGWVSTQLCFEPLRVTAWLERLRPDLHLPVHLGVAGVLDVTKLLRIGMKLGVGASLRYLRANRRAVGRLVAPGGYEPTQLLVSLAGALERLEISALHVFTFNQVARTVAWQAGMTAAAAGIGDGDAGDQDPLRGCSD